MSETAVPARVRRCHQSGGHQSGVENASPPVPARTASEYRSRPDPNPPATPPGQAAKPAVRGRCRVRAPDPPPAGRGRRTPAPARRRRGRTRSPAAVPRAIPSPSDNPDRHNRCHRRRAGRPPTDPQRRTGRPVGSPLPPPVLPAHRIRWPPRPRPGGQRGYAGGSPLPRRDGGRVRRTIRGRCDSPRR